MLYSTRVMENTGAKRNEWIESVRVLAMLLIIMFHMPSSDLPVADEHCISSIILSFMFQPAASLFVFFFLAGYFSRKNMTVKKWMMRLVALLVPYFIWNGLFSFGLNDEVTWGRVFGIGSGSFICADYPLWFVLAIIYMTVFWPIWRFSPEIAAVVCLVMSLYGDSWHCELLTHLPMPSPTVFLVFLCGVCAGRFSLDVLQKMFVYLFVPLLFIVIIGKYYYSLPYLTIVAAALFLSFMACISRVCPCIVSFTAKYSHAVFLNYATHAGIIYLLGKLYQAYFTQYAILVREMYIPFTFLIFMFNVFALRLMYRHIPWILPFIAHSGKFFWQSKQNATRVVDSA